MTTTATKKMLKANLKAKKTAAPKKPEKAKAPKTPIQNAAAEHETLAEAQRIARTIRGLRHEEEGLSTELSEVRSKIKRLTDEQITVLLDDNMGQGRLPLGDSSKNGTAKDDDGTRTTDKPAGLEAVVDGWTLRLTPDHEDFVATKERDGVATQVGIFATAINAQNELLDSIEWHGAAPDWRPIPLTNGAAKD